MTTPSQASRRHCESVGEAPARVDVSTRTVRRWIASGQLAGYRIGPRLLRLDPDPDDVDRMLTLNPLSSRHMSGRLREPAGGRVFAPLPDSPLVSGGRALGDGRGGVSTKREKVSSLPCLAMSISTRLS